MAIMIIDNYDSFTYNLYQMLQALSGEEVLVRRNDAVDFQSLVAMGLSGIVLSPGPGHPGNESDFGVCKQVVVGARQVGCPVLGVCLGHQGLVHHLGGIVCGAPRIVHGKVSRVRVDTDCPLFQGLPESIEVMRYHSLIASDDGFPDSLSVVGREESEGLIMAVMHRSLPVFGVQFHPESIGTPMGGQILRNFIERC